jgi:hypothetical protein
MLPNICRESGISKKAGLIFCKKRIMTKKEGLKIVNYKVT